MKMPSSGGLFKAVLMILTITITGCAGIDSKSEDTRDAKVAGEELAAGTGDCFGVSDENQYYQTSGQDEAGYRSDSYYNDIQSRWPNIVRRPCSDTTASNFEARPIPTRTGCTYDCDNPSGIPDNVYVPIEPGVQPTPWPYPNQVETDRCGINGNYCNYPGQIPANYPDVAVGGISYNQQDVNRCMGAFHNAGMRRGGMWRVQAPDITSVSVLSRGIVEDYGIDNNIVIINSVNVLGTTDFLLLNPNALYCIKDVSVLNRLRITSCHTSNVVVGNSVSILSNIDTRVVQCN